MLAHRLLLVRIDLVVIEQADAFKRPAAKDEGVRRLREFQRLNDQGLRGLQVRRFKVIPPTANPSWT